MANRVWYYLLGEGLTPSLSNLGLSGAPPTHPDLLETLTADFLADGGSMKGLIRRIVLSATWQQSGTLPGLSADEQAERHRLFGLARGRRLESESIVPRPASARHRPGIGRARALARPRAGAGRWRGLFDGPDSSVILARRSASVSSLQALFFLNSPHVRQVTERLAIRLQALSDDPARIREAHRLLYGRPASAEEIETGRAFLAAWELAPENTANRKARKDEPPPEVLAPWQAYIQVLLAANEFMFVP